jgi:TolC family type I secretion outer membrane protein
MNKTRNALVVISLMCIFTGCQTTNAPSVYYETWTPSPKEKTSQSEDITLASICEQEFDASKPFTLPELIDVALRNNPSTKTAWEDARSKEARERQTESAYYPSADVSAVVNKQKTSGSLEVNDLNVLNYTPNITAEYLLFDFGGRNARVREAYHTLLYSNYQYNQSIQDLLLSVATRYFELYSARSYIESTMANLLDTKTALNAAVQKFNVGLVTKLDVLQAQSSFNKAIYSFEDAKGKLKTAEANIAYSLGLSADTKVDIIEPRKDVSREVVKTINKKKVNEIIEESLKKRPDIAAGIASLHAREAAVTSANSDLWPTLNVQGSAQKDWYDYYNSISNKEDTQYNAYLSVNWDIFDGFSNINKKREAEALRDKEKEKLKQLVLSASADVWTKYYNFRTSVQKLIASKAYLNSSKTSYELALQGYDAGLKDILDLLNAQSELSNARANLIESKKDLYVALISLAHATGTLNTQQVSEELKKVTK